MIFLFFAMYMRQGQDVAEHFHLSLTLLLGCPLGCCTTVQLSHKVTSARELHASDLWTTLEQLVSNTWVSCVLDMQVYVSDLQVKGD